MCVHLTLDADLCVTLKFVRVVNFGLCFFFCNVFFISIPIFQLNNMSNSGGFCLHTAQIRFVVFSSLFSFKIDVDFIDIYLFLFLFTSLT